MFIIRATTLAGQVIASFAAAGIPAPTQLLSAEQDARRVIEASQHLGTKRDDLAVAVTTALQAGADPAATSEVQRLVTAGAIGSLGDGVETVVGGRLLNLFAQQAPQCFTAWRKAFDTAAQQLARAHARLGGIGLDDTAAVLSQRGDAAEVWGRAQQASQVIAAVDEGWVSLAQLTRMADLSADFKSLRIADVDADLWLDSGDCSRLTAWQLQCRSVPLSLATFTEYRGRVARIHARREQRDQARRDEQQAKETGRRPRAAA